MVIRASLALCLGLLSCIISSSTIEATSDSRTDAAALEEFRRGILVDPHGTLGNWTLTNAQTMCASFGIQCNSNGRVTSLSLENQSLQGPLSASLHDLSFLQLLNLTRNSFSASVPPEWGSLVNLKQLDVSNNTLTGLFPEIILHLPLIGYVDISNNKFEGVIQQPLKLTSFKYSNNPHLQVVSPNGNRGIHTLVVDIVCVLIAMAILLVLFLYCWKQMQHKLNKQMEKNIEAQNVPPGLCPWKGLHHWPSFSYTHIMNFSLKELAEATKNFSNECLLGTGGFGMVYKAELKTGETMALKRATAESVQGTDEFQNEVKLLSRVHHRHLVNLIGFCCEDSERILVYEFVPNGSLLNHLSGAPRPLTWRQRINIAIGAAKGLAYLHEGCSPPIIHRDMKPSNILLDEEFEAKISDLGLSKPGPSGDESHVSTLVRGTLGYLDPHYYLTFHLTISSDIYSFGVILLQLVTARPAIDLGKRRSHYNIIRWATPSIKNDLVETIIDPSLAELGYNQHVMTVMAQLGLRCTSRDIKMRPPISLVIQELEQALQIADATYKLSSPIFSA